MSERYNLQRFIDAQDGVFERALQEIRAGRKQSHWMWFIFPQLRGLGRSATADYYGIGSCHEARAYLDHPLLGARLRQMLAGLQPWAGQRSAEQLLGGIDAMKLRSSLTLFDSVEPAGVFAEALESFYGGARDERTLALLNAVR